MSYSYYGKLCTEVYDLTKRVGQSLGGDLEYYQERLSSCKGRILEAMVGSGRVIIPLLEAGLLVDGVDYSAEMLESCRKRCEDRGLNVRLFESNLVELDLPDRYEAIIIPGGSFLLIENREESIAALKRLYDHLQPGGRLLLDLFLPDTHFESGGFSGSSTFQLPDGDLITMEGKLLEASLFDQYKVTLLKYEKWRNGALIETEMQRFALRWYGVHEFKLVLESIGFTDVVVSANYEFGRAPSDGKQNYAYEAIKK
ncbi:class I SAM-dependent methyltransferase [Paenibacillus sp. BC26]|uniref:class I SAM-dependent methyltransferase n=1 Tax=Paenibacillus sp. BC26 TaxID=1881032 RepID=UPI0008EDF85B|nr:class I SAM-dependent methyltransferase [Paenibacillus sp. BC26]SFS71898.1 Methyltransferase domain-containing protein [Paenibacillus sp. BC26]